MNGLHNPDPRLNGFRPRWQEAAARRERVLDLWAEGLPAADIARRVGLERRSVVRFAAAARAAGDPRATLRLDRAAVRQRDAAMIAAVRARPGRTVASIAREFGVPRSLAGKVICRARSEGRCPSAIRRRPKAVNRLVLELWAAGETLRAICRETGLSREVAQAVLNAGRARGDARAERRAYRTQRAAAALRSAIAIILRAEPWRSSREIAVWCGLSVSGARNVMHRLRLEGRAPPTAVYRRPADPPPLPPLPREARL